MPRARATQGSASDTDTRFAAAIAHSGASRRGRRDGLDGALGQACSDYARALPGKLTAVAREIAAARAAPHEPGRLRAIRDRAHKLRGTAGSYGFAAVGLAAGVIEDALARSEDGGGGLEREEWNAIEQALADALAGAERATPLPEVSPRRPMRRPRAS